MTSHDVIQASVAAHNRRAEKIARDVEPYARAILGLAIAVAGALALVAWATPCETGHQCLALLAAPRRAVGNALAGTWLHRAWVWPRAAYLRLVISWAQDEVDDMEFAMRMPQCLPADRAYLQRQMRIHRLWIAERQIKLIDLELASRPATHYGGTQ